MGERILHGQWSSPAWGRWRLQVVSGQGDGWVRGYEAVSRQLGRSIRTPRLGVAKTRNEVATR